MYLVLFKKTENWPHAANYLGCIHVLVALLTADLVVLSIICRLPSIVRSRQLATDADGDSEVATELRAWLRPLHDC